MFSDFSWAIMCPFAVWGDVADKYFLLYSFNRNIPLVAYLSVIDSRLYTYIVVFCLAKNMQYFVANIKTMYLMRKMNQITPQDFVPKIGIHQLLLCLVLSICGVALITRVFMLLFAVSHGIAKYTSYRKKKSFYCRHSTELDRLIKEVEIDEGELCEED